MSKNYKKAKTTFSSFALSVKPVPAGKVSLAEFVSSEAGQRAVHTALEMEHTEKAFAILCAYQTYEICNELQEVGRFDLLENEAFQEHMVVWIVKERLQNCVDILTLVWRVICRDGNPSTPNVRFAKLHTALDQRMRSNSDKDLCSSSLSEVCCESFVSGLVDCKFPTFVVLVHCSLHFCKRLLEQNDRFFETALSRSWFAYF